MASWTRTLALVSTLGAACGAVCGAAGCGGNGTATASRASHDPIAPAPELPSVIPAGTPAELPGHARWESYGATIKDTSALITVDVAAQGRVPDRTRPQLLVVMIEMIEAGESGLVDQSPRSRLTEIRAYLERQVTPALAGHYVGHVTREGTVEHYIYLPAGVDSDATLEAAERKFPRHRWLAYPSDDAAWVTYTTLLLPSPSDLERVRNERVIEHLRALGDVLGRSRPVDHFCAFPEHVNAREFAKAVAAAGFDSLLIDPSAQSDPARPYEVRVRHVDAVTLDRLTDVTLRLRRLAGDYAGRYGTWGCAVVK